jgi:ppGpp synthetase/RelA/SpoT-type nucleotidyltranferase
MATPHERIGLSRSQVDRAGEILRTWTLGGLLAGAAEQDASRVVNAYRSEFKSPLRSVVMGLRSAVRTADAEVVVAERLKRQPRLVGKLIRFPNIRLTQMQDVAGCRAILPNLAVVDEVRRRIERQKSEIVKVNDYNSTPRSSGYRAVHLVVRRDGALVEIQLRTASQQRWAMLVEDLDATYRFQLKDETGPEEVLEYLRVYALGLSEIDRTGAAENETRRQMETALSNAQRRLITGDKR